MTRMTTRSNTNTGGPGKETKERASLPVAAKEGSCRCKETSEMKPRQLLKLMLSDLAFWKKTKRG